MIITFALMLVTGRPEGVTTNEDDATKSDVQLSSNGSGAARYLVTGMDDELDGEWVVLPVDFKWTAGNVIDMGEVDVSLHPVSMRGDAYFVDEKGPTPRFVESDNPMTVISVTPCRTTLLFPFVTNQGKLRYRTGHHEYLGGRWLLHDRVQRFRCSSTSRERPIQSRAVSSGSKFLSTSCAGIPGLYHCNLRISGWVRLCLSSLTASGSERPPWRRAISRCARIAIQRIRRPIVQRLLA